MKAPETQTLPVDVRAAIEAATPGDVESLDRARRVVAGYRDRMTSRQIGGKHGDRRRIRNQHWTDELGECYRRIVDELLAAGWR